MKCVAGKYLVDAATVDTAHDSETNCTMGGGGTYNIGHGNSAGIYCIAGRHLADAGINEVLHIKEADCLICPGRT